MQKTCSALRKPARNPYFKLFGGGAGFGLLDRGVLALCFVTGPARPIRKNTQLGRHETISARDSLCSVPSHLVFYPGAIGYSLSSFFSIGCWVGREKERGGKEQKGSDKAGVVLHMRPDGTNHQLSATRGFIAPSVCYRSSFFVGQTRAVVERAILIPPRLLSIAPSRWNHRLGHGRAPPAAL